MLDKLLEQWAARRDPRFRVFVEAKEAYEAFVEETHVRFDEMTDEHYRRGREDPRLDTARRGFAAAIEMSKEAGALADEAVAKYQLGLVYHARGELDQAAEFINAALNVLDSLPNRDRAEDTTGCFYQLGVIALKKGRLPEAVSALRRSRQMDEANADLSGMRMCDLALAKCAEKGAATEAGLTALEEGGDWDLPESDLEPTEEERTEPEGTSGHVRFDQRELIWLVSYSVEANDALMEHLGSLGNEFGRPVAVSRVAFGAADPEQRNLRRPESDQHLCAAILVLEREGLHDSAFQELATACMHRVLAVSDFRLLVYLSDLTVDELRTLADGNLFVARLFDTTQIADLPSLEQLRRTLVPYVRRVEQIRVAALWRDLRLRLSGACGKLATGILLAAIAVSLLGFPAWFLKTKPGWLGPHGPELASLALGLLAFPLQAPLIFLLLRGVRAAALAPRDNVILRRWVLFGAVIMLAANYFQQIVGGPLSWALLGLAIGVLLDAIRRAGYQARREMIDVEALIKDTANSAMQDPKTTVLRGDPINPFSCPLLPSPSERVFISYTRSSDKGSRLARALYSGLKKAGASPFLDRANIPVGASWRRSLNQHIGKCDTFICILDVKGVQREWVAAELLAAIEAHRVTGTPHIVILMDPAIKRLSQAMLPVFRGVASAATESPMQGRPQIIQLNRQTLSSLVWGLAPGRFVATAVFTRSLATSIMLVLNLVGRIGSLGIMAGFILGFLAMLGGMAKFPLASSLADRGWLEPVALLSGFWLGLMARATLAWRCERTDDREMGMTIPAIATAGMAFAFLLLAPKTSGLIATWSATFVVAGWMMVSSVMRMATGRQAYE